MDYCWIVDWQIYSCFKSRQALRLVLTSLVGISLIHFSVFIALSAGCCLAVDLLVREFVDYRFSLIRLFFDCYLFKHLGSLVYSFTLVVDG